LEFWHCYRLTWKSMAIGGLRGYEDLVTEVPPVGLGTFRDGPLFSGIFYRPTVILEDLNCLINAFSLSTFRLSRGQTMTNQKIEIGFCLLSPQLIVFFVVVFFYFIFCPAILLGGLIERPPALSSAESG